MKIDLVIKNANVPFGDNLVKSDILIAKGKIAGIVSEWKPDAAKIIDAEGLMVLPGCIDSHVHFMDPGFTHRETFKSGSHSAAVGGLTTVVDMPCCSIPSVRDLASLFNKKEIIEKQSYIDFGMWGGITGEDVQEGNLANVKRSMKLMPDPR
ncbi:MAG: amidohydrolase family protein [Spirochaetia bacterium]|nr:amidohydrolase family protein [Spirochaetia bacterium]